MVNWAQDRGGFARRLLDRPTGGGPGDRNMGVGVRVGLVILGTNPVAVGVVPSRAPGRPDLVDGVAHAIVGLSLLRSHAVAVAVVRYCSEVANRSSERQRL